ncbi:MAG TPA: DUF4339 domain-containing protein [Fimbriimonas sp.]|nr:DUF4339 domain-containing protein [Fimbriimonas sp.]
MADSTEPAAQPTFSIIGADGKTYGPVDFSTLRDWARDGRVLRTTMVIENATGRHTPASEVAGLFEGLQPPTMGSPRSEEAPVERKKTSPGMIAAAVLVGSCCLCIPVFAAILFPVFSQAKMAAQKTASLSNLKQLSLGVIMYTTDWDDRYPLHMDSAVSLKPAIMPYIKNDMAFVSPHPKGSVYLGNPKLSAKNSAKVVDPATTILLYDSLPWQPRDVAVEAFADGHAVARDPFDNMILNLQKDPFKP